MGFHLHFTLTLTVPTVDSHRLVMLKNRENLTFGPQKGIENRGFCRGFRTKIGQNPPKRAPIITKSEPELPWTWPIIGATELENIRELAQFCTIFSGFNCLMRRFERV